jgi:hypothetical protein
MAPPTSIRRGCRRCRVGNVSAEAPSTHRTSTAGRGGSGRAGAHHGEVPGRHACAISTKSAGREAARVKAVDVVHRDPLLTLVLAALVNTDDVGMAEGRRQVGLAAEAGAVLVVGGHVCRKHLQDVKSR